MNSLYILGAILLLSFTALNTQRHKVDVAGHQMRSDIEMRATVLGTRLLDHLATLPFDANADLGDLALLTPPDLFGGATSWATASTLEQVHGLTFVVNDVATAGTLPFQVSASVRYVSTASGGFVPSITPTAHKEVRLAITSELGATFGVQRIYSLDS